VARLPARDHPGSPGDRRLRLRRNQPLTSSAPRIYGCRPPDTAGREPTAGSPLGEACGPSRAADRLPEVELTASQGDEFSPGLVLAVLPSPRSATSSTSIGCRVSRSALQRPLLWRSGGFSSGPEWPLALRTSASLANWPSG
jgi:hypothetical protein